MPALEYGEWDGSANRENVTVCTHVGIFSCHRLLWKQPGSLTTSFYNCVTGKYSNVLTQALLRDLVEPWREFDARFC